MITAAWTAYLASMLIITFMAIVSILCTGLKGDTTTTRGQNIAMVASGIMWAIWYMYFLH